MLLENAASVQDGAEALEEKYLVFSILEKLYAFPSNQVSEIAVFDTVYPLPLMPAYVLGIINRYSVPYVLFDIGLLLFGESSPQGKVLVIKENIDRIAFLIDDIADMVDISKDLLFEVERSAETGDITEVISKSFKWNDDDVFILDIERILSRASRETSG